MTMLDGNVLAGRLADIFGWDATAADARCAHCGAHGVIAVSVVHVSAMGMVARCAQCDGVLATFVDADDRRSWFAMPGISALEIAR
jgi:hypothetical protein